MPSERPTPPFVVRLSLHDAPLGRVGAVAVGYRASVAKSQDADVAYSAMVTAAGPAAIEPGAAGTAVLEPLVPASWAGIRTGEELLLLEGPHEIGRAVVVQRPHWRTLRAAGARGSLVQAAKA